MQASKMRESKQFDAKNADTEKGIKWAVKGARKLASELKDECLVQRKKENKQGARLLATKNTTWERDKFAAMLATEETREQVQECRQLRKKMEQGNYMNFSK